MACQNAVDRPYELGGAVRRYAPRRNFGRPASGNLDENLFFSGDDVAIAQHQVPGDDEPRALGPLARAGAFRADDYDRGGDEVVDLRRFENLVPPRACRFSVICRPGQCDRGDGEDKKNLENRACQLSVPDCFVLG